MTRGKLPFHCNLIPFVDSVLTRDKLTLTVSRSHRNKQTRGDFSFADVRTSSMKAVHLSYGVTTTGVFGVHEGLENILKITQCRKCCSVNHWSTVRYGSVHNYFI